MPLTITTRQVEVPVCCLLYRYCGQGKLLLHLKNSAGALRGNKELHHSCESGSYLNPIGAQSLSAVCGALQSLVARGSDH
jgi:hypothetical protein